MPCNDPLIDGISGWTTQNRPPLMQPERPGPFDWTVRHLPAAIRVLGTFSGIGLPRMGESESYHAVRALTDERARRRVDRLRFAPDDREATWAMVRWLSMVEPAARWWKSTSAWRSPREFRGWRTLERQHNFPHVEPYELAQMRLPEDVSMDADVVLLQAWCQGVMHGNQKSKLQVTHEAFSPFTERTAAGLVKLHRSPWFMFTLAAPHMAPMGVLFGDYGILRSAERMETLLSHPYLATDGELEAVFRAPTWSTGYDRARTKRERGEYTNPDGGWYALNHRHALGLHFRRGAEWTAKQRGKR